MRREAQLAALRYDEERHKNRSLQRDSVTSYTKHKAAQSPTKSSPESENVYPSRRSTHTDDSALFMGEDRAALSPTANQSPSYPSSGGVASCRTAGLRPESFLFRLSQKEEKRKGDAAAPQTRVEAPAAPAAPPLVGEDAELVEQLRKNIEARLKVSLPSDLGAALTDGVVLCHLANHVRPRSVPSIHVPSPAVPKLTMAKCRRNVENFLEACRRMGVPQSQLCLPLHILEERGLPQVARTVSALLDLAPPRHPVTTTTPTPGPSASM
ncbi:DISP complex protein LRCH3-like [Sebastes umbrosus]|uniref:DISP complex protein LRCH3-like n=1 Tax=Sebastes umbrosus TaxID=72105 RepID=UPI00189D9A56|nr:DISP complex protein LRCH3-like [Sebastes umbrosus]